MVLTSAQLCILCTLFLVSPVYGQRGCPSEGCDSRGLNCQADFQLNSSSASIKWKVDVGTPDYDDLRTAGCVGNNANIICKVSNSHSKGFVSLDAMTGAVKWYDTLLTNPRQPIMNIQGDIIATDSRYMEMRLSNGTEVGKPNHFDGYINETSSIHYVQDQVLYFFTSYQSGGLYMYDTSGMCVASYFLDVKDPVTNHTMSVWVPVTRLIVNTEVEPPCSYFIAQNNNTLKYRIYALNFNHQPPYLSEKWHIDIEPDVTDRSSVAAARMLVRGTTLFCSVGDNLTLVISDQMESGSIKQRIAMFTSTFSSFDYPVGSPRYSKSRKDQPPVVWLNTIQAPFETVLYGWDSYSDSGPFKYSINLSKMFNFSFTALTSELMVFGYHPEDTTLVFAFNAFNLENEDQEEGNYLVALKPMADGTVVKLWSMRLGGVEAGAVLGQIIGVKGSMLIAASLGDTSSSVYGIKVGP